MRSKSSLDHSSGPSKFSRTVPATPQGYAPIVKARGSLRVDARNERKSWSKVRFQKGRPSAIKLMKPKNTSEALGPTPDEKGRREFVLCEKLFQFVGDKVGGNNGVMVAKASEDGFALAR